MANEPKVYEGEIVGGMCPGIGITGFRTGDGLNVGDRVKITVEKVEPDGSVIGLPGVKFPVKSDHGQVIDASGWGFIITEGSTYANRSTYQVAADVAAILNAAYDAAVAKGQGEQSTITGSSGAGEATGTQYNKPGVPYTLTGKES